MLFQQIVGLQTLWFLMAFFGYILAQYLFLPKGSIGLAKFALVASCLGSVILAVMYAYLLFMGGGAMALVMLGVWIWATHQSSTMLRQLL